MGTIHFPKHEPLKSFFDVIPATNWRTLGDLGGDRIEIVIARFHRFEIEDMTIEYFHNMNRYRHIVERKFKYINNPAACSICHGHGKVDWIQKARAHGTKVIEIHKAYWRDKNNTNCLMPIRHQVTHLYGSQPKLYEGQEICGRCKGTGMEEMKATQFLFEQEDE